MTGKSPNDRTGLWLALILVCAFAAHAPALLNGFTFDDAFYVKGETPYGTPNPMVATLHPLPEYFQRPYNHGVSDGRGYRPLTVYSFALLHHWARTPVQSGILGDRFVESAWPQHLCNSLLHVLCTLLVFGLVRRLTGAGPALLASLLFGALAVHTEAVAWIVGRGELLAFAGGATGALCFASGLLSTGPRRAAWLAAAAAAVFVACASKESGVAWALFVPLYAIAVRVRRGAAWRAGAGACAVAWLATCGLPVAVFAWMRHAVLQRYVAPRGAFEVPYEFNPLFELGFFERLPSAVMLLGYGLYKTLVPIDLSCSYRHAVFELPVGFAHWGFLSTAIGLAVAVYLAWRWRQQPLWWLALASFTGLAVVTSNLPFAIETVFAERFYYAPSLGLALVAAALVAATGARGRRLCAAAVVCLSLANVALSARRSMQWADDATLFAADVESQPRSIELQLNLAGQRFDNFDEAGGRAALERALQLGPRIPRVLREVAAYRLGVAVRAARGGRQEQAEAGFAEVEAMLLDALQSEHYQPRRDGRDTQVLLAELCVARGDDDGARRALQRALEFDPRSDRVRLRLKLNAEDAGDDARAASLLREGLALDGDSAYLLAARGRRAHRAGDHDGAARDFAASLPRLPHEVWVVEAWCEYAASLAALGRTADSVEIATAFLAMGVQGEQRAALERLAATPPG